MEPNLNNDISTENTDVDNFLNQETLNIPVLLKEISILDPSIVKDLPKNVSVNNSNLGVNMTNNTEPNILTLVQNYLAQSPYEEIFPLQGVQSIGMQEGLRQVAYKDSRGRWTIGLGHTPAVEGEKWSLDTCFSVFFNDVNSIGVQPVNTNLPWSSSMSTIRHWVNINASYNMGINDWLQFTEVFSGMQTQDWALAVRGMMDSIWYENQVPDRVNALAYQLYFNEWVIGYLTTDQFNQFKSIFPNAITNL